MNAVVERTEVMPPNNGQMVAITPMAMINQAMERGASIEVLTKLMELQERWEKGQALKAFDEAVADAKAEIPPAAKNREGHNSKKYADFAAYAAVVDPIIHRYGLSYRFRSKQDDRIHVTCILSHRMGHHEENTLSGPADTTGSKNAIQAIGSTLSYLQRYSLIQALGLSAAEDDDGKAAGMGAALSAEQVEAIRGLIVETGSDIAKFCAWLKVEKIEDLAAAHYDRAVKALEAKRAKA